MGRRTRRLLAAGLVVLPLLGLPAVTPQPASAQTADVVCPFVATLTIEPGLVPTAGTVTVSGTLEAGAALTAVTPCVSTGPTRYRGGTATVSGTGTLACTGTGLAGSAAGAETLTWDNGETSTITWNATIAGRAPTLTATVVSGALAGDTVTSRLVLTGSDGRCGASPVTMGRFAGGGVFARA